MSTQFSPTRTAGLERLSDFLPKAGRAYAARRNFDMGAGAHTDVSCLSPYLRCRVLTEEEVLASVVAKHGPDTAEKFIQEVFWRTYWKGWLELRPGVWGQYQSALQNAWNDVQTQSGLRVRWEAACHGTTGIDCFDAWAEELVQTGYLHNHARMWFASIWVFTLELPWELGADFFLRHLLDGDPASNTLGWRWVAGIQTPGKTYLARTSNISKFTEGRFHPKWRLASEALPRTAPTLPDPRDLPQQNAPQPDHRTGFLLHEDDLSPGFALEACDIQNCAVLTPQTGIGPLAVAKHVIQFRQAAQQDTLARYSERLGPVAPVDTAKALLDWAQANDIQQILTPYAPTGPTATTLDHFAGMDGAPSLCRVVRGYDQLTWPKATKGFFPFKSNIPMFLHTIDGNRAA